MNPRELESFMRENGFMPKRRTTTGVLWFDGLSYVNVAQKYSSPVALKNLECDVKRCVRKRTATAVQQGELPMNDTKPITPRPTPLTQKLPITPLANGHANGMVPSGSIVAPAPEKKERKKVRRFTGPQRFIVWREIFRLHHRGLDTVGIAVALRDGGHRMSDGSAIDNHYIRDVLLELQRDPHWAQHVNDWAREMGWKPAPPPQAITNAIDDVHNTPVAVAPKPPTPVVVTTERKIPAWIVGFLNNPELDAQEKIDLILLLGKT